GGMRRAVIQGYGNAGSHIARMLHDDGWLILGVSDSSGAICSPSGLRPDQIEAAKQGGGSVKALAGKGDIRAIDAEELLGLECDLLVPAAMENQIHEGNADRIRAKVVLELANGPTTALADGILERKGI